MKDFQLKAALFPFGKKTKLSSITFFCGLLAIFAVAAIVKYPFAAAAQTTQKNISGEWSARIDRNRIGEINFTFQRRSEKGGFNMTSENLPVSRLQGLSAESDTSAKSEVRFSIVREAGTFACEGYFSEGKGVGFWTLTPNEKFISQMNARGYTNLTEENLLSAALHDLTIGFIEEMKTAGYDKLTFEQLRRARTHDVTTQFIRELKSAGYENLTMEELVRAKNHDIDIAYINEAKAMGFDRLPMEKLIRMRNHEITAEFISQMKSAGLENLSLEELIRLKNHDVTAAFISEIKAEGFSDVTAETAVRLKNHDVNRDFIRRAKSQGFNTATLEELIRLRRRDAVK